MKTKIIFFVLIGLFSLKAQSILSIGGTATLDVSVGADICSDSLAGTVTGNGTFCGSPTDIESESTEIIPIEFSLKQNFPNPFNPSTTINFSIPKEELVSLKLFNSLGEEVAELINETKPAGNYSVEFNVGRSAAADSPDIASGVYFYKISAGNFVETKKMILLR